MKSLAQSSFLTCHRIPLSAVYFLASRDHIYTFIHIHAIPGPYIPSHDAGQTLLLQHPAQEIPNVSLSHCYGIPFQCLHKSRALSCQGEHSAQSCPCDSFLLGHPSPRTLWWGTPTPQLPHLLLQRPRPLELRKGNGTEARLLQTVHIHSLLPAPDSSHLLFYSLTSSATQAAPPTGHRFLASRRKSFLGLYGRQLTCS